jgi:hypothetical protein
MQKYQSRQNLKLMQEAQPKQKEKDYGDLPFEVDPNSSVRLTINYKLEFKSLPFVFTQLVSPETDFDMTHSVSNKTNKNFVVNVQNVSNQPIKGLVSWFAFTNLE